MSGVIMTTRGSPASRYRPDFARVYRFSGGEVTGPECLPGPAAPSGRGGQATGRPTGPSILSKSRGAGEAGSERIRRLLAADLAYVSHPSFEDPGARDAILAPVPGYETPWPDRAEAPLGAGAVSPSVDGFPSREQETHMFRRLNYLKHLACRIRDRIDPDAPAPIDLDEFERLRTEAVRLRNRLAETHLRLVVMVAERHVKDGHDLAERVSDGCLALVRAADRFDFSRGYRFSTYATWAIFNQVVQCERKERRCTQLFAMYRDSLAALHPASDQDGLDEAPDGRGPKVEQLLRRLDRHERRIIVHRNGIRGMPELTLRQIGLDLGISKERVRQIEARAHDKLRRFALLEGMAPSDLSQPTGIEAP